MLFYQEGERLEIIQLKIRLNLHRVKCYFPRKGKTKNYTVKSSFDGTQGTRQLLYSVISTPQAMNSITESWDS